MITSFFSTKTNLWATVLIIGIVAINYNIIIYGLNADFFGVLASVGLFIYGGRYTKKKVNYWLILMIFVFEFISFRLQTKSLHFLSIVLFFCLLYYLITKKCSYIALICILLFSSLFNKFFEHLTAEIKQYLCFLVYKSLKNILNINKIEGVNFYLNQSKITIDTACMGLSMFKTGLLTAAIILTLEEKKAKKNYSVLQIIMFCVLVILLNLVANYFRIVTLVFLSCTQENTLHHLVGLACFVLYQVLPMLILIKFLKPKKVTENQQTKPIKIIPIAFVLIFILITSFKMQQTQNNDLLENIDPVYNTKKGNWVNPEVFKISTPKKIIYIKTPVHKPLICWTGNGYKITYTQEICRNNQCYWLNKMEKNGKIYQSVWWYESNQKKHTNYITVIWQKLIFNQPIRLINEVEILN